jgi:putative transposase
MVSVSTKMSRFNGKTKMSAIRADRKETIVVDQFSLFEQLGQAEDSEAGDIFRNYLRGAVRHMFAKVMEAEVELMTGPKYHPTENRVYRRAGSTDGRVLYEGREEAVKRPRVRRVGCDGSTKEVQLETYMAAQEPSELEAAIVRAMAAGASTREVSAVYPESPKTSRSNVSRLWATVGKSHVRELRTRDIASQDWLVLMLDGIHLSKDQTAVAAIGITSDGVKCVLDFELGNSENYEVCRDLLARIKSRGFKTAGRLLAVTDGAAALKKAILKHFDDAIIQRCLVHKERNIRARLSMRDWGELARRFKRLREVQGECAAREALAELERFMKTKNAAALASLHEAGEELIALHKLDVPSTLHVSLLSTNVIENSYRNTRRKIGRVTRYRAETDQASHWLAFALSEAEKGFRRIQGYADLKYLKAALARRDVPASAASPSSPVAALPPSPPTPPMPTD